MMLNPEESLRWAALKAKERQPPKFAPDSVSAEEAAQAQLMAEKETAYLRQAPKPIQDFGSARSELSGLGYTLIPVESLRAIGKIYQEGEAKYKSGAVNARNLIPVLGNHSWQYERAEHAVDHLLKFFSGDESEDHLAKVAWFCTTMREIVRLEKEKGLPHAFSASNV